MRHTCLLLFAAGLACAQSAHSSAQPQWHEISNTETMLALVNYEEYYEKAEVAVVGGVIGIYDKKAGKYTAGSVNEIVHSADKSGTVKSSTRVCIWGQVERLKGSITVSDKDRTWNDVLRAPACNTLSRVTGTGNLDYQRIGEDWLDVVRGLQSLYEKNHNK